MAKRTGKYWDVSLSTDRRVADLLGRMTLAEKFAQLATMWKDPIMDKRKTRFVPELARKIMPDGWGVISDIFRTFRAGHSARIANDIQKFTRDETRLGIPVLIQGETLHGCRCIGSTMFPQAIGLAATWNPELMGQVAAVTGRETRARGIHQGFAPVCDIARDARAGRTEETYGEDPVLATRLAVAYVKGIQAEGVMATPKHFVANFVGDGGRDSHAITFSERILREIYLPVFEACVKEAGAMSIMSAYHSLDGVPCSANKWLLTDLLRKEWGFAGIVVSDWFAVDIMHRLHRTVATKGEAGARAIESGMDIELPYTDCFKDLPAMLKQGKLSRAAVDAAVANVLRVKFQLGLFENPYVDADAAVEITNTKGHRALALEAARQGIVLLKNDGILPLAKKVKSIAVIGPNAAIARLGGYSNTGSFPVSPLAGITKAVGKGVKVTSAEGCPLKEVTRKGFAKAVAVAKQAELVVLCVGNCAFDTEGEGQDRCNLDLPGAQQDLVLAVTAVNKNVVVVLNGGSAITMGAWIDRVRAIVDVWHGGEEGGTALAEVLLGKTCPGGKLPITFPVTTGECPLYYNIRPTGRGWDYSDLRGKLYQFPFGFGLSYTTFGYSDLEIARAAGAKSKVKGKATVTVRAKITNTGAVKGDEIVQVYIHDTYSSISRPVKELKAFQRLTLEPGQAQTVEFTLTEKDFAMLGPDLKPMLEPGEFEIMVGSSCEDIRLSGKIVL